MFGTVDGAHRVEVEPVAVSADDDLAVLRPGELPDGVTPLPLLPVPPAWGTSVRCFGPAVTGGGTTKLALADPGTQTTAKGKPVSLRMTATGGSGGYRFTATGLPAGLSVDAATGVISGTPGTWANYHPTVTVVDSSGAKAAVSFYWFVFPA